MLDKLIAQIEKAQPFFEKLSRNIYLRSIKDGFLSAMPVILFSSLFMIVAYVPNTWGFYWSPEVETMLVKPYTYSMSILGLLVAITTTKHLSDNMNRDLPATKQINSLSAIFGAISAFLLFSADEITQVDGETVISGFSRGYMGTTGLLAAFIAAFLTCLVYRFCVKRDIGFKVPEEVPPNIAQAFTDVIPYAVVVLIAYGVEIAIRKATGGSCLAQAVIELFQPLFTAADGYIGIAIIYGAMAFFWFVGIHGPSIVEPAISAIAFANLEANLQLIQAGEHASHIITPGTQYFVATFGGTGATFVVPFMYMWMAKSKQNKAVGRASVIPTSFGVNEPILFGGPLVLNPIYFIPFILAPIANVWLFKFFVEVLGMNSFSYNLPWPTPGPIGLVLGTGFDKLSFLLVAVILVVDWIIYYPFFKVYDQQVYEEELANAGKEETVEETEEIVDEIKEVEVKELEKEVNVLVLCAGAGTSALMANALNKAAEEYDANIVATAGAYGGHQQIMQNMDLVILAPQVASNYEDIKKDADRLGIKVVKTEGKEYIDLTRDPEGSLEFVMKNLND